MQFPIREPVIHGWAREPFVGVPAATFASPGDRAPAALEDLDGLVLLPAQAGLVGPRFHGVPDDNRSTIFPDIVAHVAGRGYAACVKGVGARAPLYGLSPLDFTFDPDVGGGRGIPPSEGQSRRMTGESWFGESPYGAQGRTPGASAIEITGLADGCSIGGFFICPTVALAEIPEEHVRGARERFWYRRHKGPFFQEQRLVPSNVRLYHQSELTLGRTPAEVLRLFGVETAGALDAFIEAYIASGVAALTVFARTVRPCAWGVQGLDFGNVWLDKDCLLAPDGTLHFADLEGLDWVLAGHDKTVEDRVRDQFHRNAYEFQYGLDVLLREREVLADRRRSHAERRAALIPRFEIALARDPFVRCETSAEGLDLVVRPPTGGFGAVAIRAIDLR